MAVEPTTLTRIGAWGQLVAATLVTVCWMLAVPTGVVVASGGYVLLTLVGIVGMARAESVPGIGPLVYPFVVPGFLALYHFSTRH